MPSPLSGPMRAATRGPDVPLNVLLMGCTHERYESNLTRTGHNFFMLTGDGLKPWNTDFAPVPANVFTVRGTDAPAGVGVDLVLSQTRGYQFALAAGLARRHGVPHVNLAHTLPPRGWAGADPHLSADEDVFISEYSRDAWGYGGGLVVEHGVDTALFRPYPGEHRGRHVLAVANRFRERDAELGFTFWREATGGLPTVLVGDNPGMSSAASGPAHLALLYRTSRVFANTAQASPVPTSLLEAMASGCAVVSTRNPMVETVIGHGVNGLLAEDSREMGDLLGHLLDNPAEAEAMGLEARRTIEERFGLDKHVAEWNRIFRRAAGGTGYEG